MIEPDEFKYEDWTMEGPAVRVAEMLWEGTPKRFPVEILRISDDIAAIVVDVDGVDYVFSMERAPTQRDRPVLQ